MTQVQKQYGSDNPAGNAQQATELVQEHPMFRRSGGQPARPGQPVTKEQKQSQLLQQQM